MCKSWPGKQRVETKTRDKEIRRPAACLVLSGRGEGGKGKRGGVEERGEEQREEMKGEERRNKMKKEGNDEAKGRNIDRERL